jgi:ABC-2 type transport system ATP-binding protein
VVELAASAPFATIGLTCFLTTHNLAEAEKVCDQVGVIRQGRLVAVGTPQELRARTGKPTVEVYGKGVGEQALAALRSQPRVSPVSLHNDHLVLQLEPDAETAPLISLLVREGAQVEEVRKAQGSLEEAFVALMQEGSQEEGAEP